MLDNRTVLRIPRITLLLVGLVAVTVSCGPDQPAIRRPNLLLILTDDLGYGDLSIQGSEEVDTPRIDGLAAEGVRLTNAYVSAPICAPARAGLITGRYQQRFGYAHYTGKYQEQVDQDRGVPTSEIFMSDPLREAGYRTGFIGKWHLGINEKYRPHRRGFDEWFGFLSGRHDYLDWSDLGDGPIWRDNKPVQGTAYLTDAFSDEAVAFIDRHKAEPFFLYLAFNAVHTPIMVPDTYLEGIETQDSDRRVMLGMVRAIDRGVGRILDKLEVEGLSENTLVVFVNDNGGAKLASNEPLRGEKATMWEGGSRVPMIMRWPGHLNPNAIYEPSVSTLDLFPTFLSLAGAAIPMDRKIDGVNLMPFLSGTQEGPVHDTLYWSFERRGNMAVRSGDWKLMKQDRDRRLHNLADDLSEEDNLFDKHPEIVEELQAKWNDWKAEMVEPLWH
jgi:arylsulfatase A-like enzyme